MHEAKVAHSLDWRRAAAQGADGRRYPTIFHHPPGQGGASDAAFAIALPPARPGHRIVFRFGTVLTARSEDGVGFAVLVDGRQVWSAKQRVGAATEHSLDLSAHAGRTIQLTLRVDALGNATYDWANWLRPLIVFQPD